jgi:predicted phage terminase large subunit-like protein
MTFSATLNAIRALCAKWPQADRKLIEDKANGTAVVETLQREITGLIALNPKGGKIARANAVSANVETGNVYLPLAEHASWVGDFVEEFAAFPAATHDDQVDAMSQAHTWYIENNATWAFEFG